MDVHFEILFYDGHGWRVHDVMPEERAALAMGHGLWRSGKYKAVRVVRERFEADRGVFSSFQIFHEGQKVEARQQTSLMEIEDRPVKCWKMGDLYSYEGRRSIGRLLTRTLEAWRITPTELLHHPSYYRRLDDSGTELQAAVQRVAVDQMDGGGSPVQERMREIFKLVDQAVSRLNEFWNAKRVPDVDPGELDIAIAALAREEERGFAFAAGLAEHFAATETVPDKLRQCLDMLQEDRPKWLLAVLDGMIAEMLPMKAVMPLLLQGVKGTRAELERLALLRHGKLPSDPADGGGDIARLNAAMAAGLLPDSVTALDGVLVRRIAQAGKMADGGLLNELKALAKIGRLCVDALPETNEARLRFEQALAGRCQQLLTSHAIALYLADTEEAYDWLDRLVALEPYVCGRANKRELANAILPILTGPEREKQLARVDKQVMQRMQRLAKLQRALERSKFEPMQKDKMAYRCDMLCNRMLEESDFLKRFDATPAEAWEKALKLLHYLADVTFTEGKAAQAVRRQARGYMRVGNFLESCVQHTDDPIEGARQLKGLMELMTAAGLSHQDSDAA